MTRDITGLVEAVELYELGLPPVAGGQLDQTEKFLQAARFWRGERNRLQAPE